MHPAPTPAPEPLTGAGTSYWRDLFPKVWSGLVGTLVVLVWLDVLGDAPAPGAVKWVATGIWGGLSAFFFTYFGRLRHVWRDGDEILVGEDPHRALRLHLREVSEVRESRFQQVKTVTLELTRPTPLGRTIRFVPKGAKTYFLPYASSPVARELKERHQLLLTSGGPEG